LLKRLGQKNEVVQLLKNNLHQALEFLKTEEEFELWGTIIQKALLTEEDTKKLLLYLKYYGNPAQVIWNIDPNFEVADELKEFMFAMATTIGIFHEAV
jgi:hypothetical protein